MAFKLSPKPPQEVILPETGDRDLTTLERAIQRSDIKIDVAACIRNTFAGVSLVILSVGFVIYPEAFPLREAVGSMAQLLPK